MALKVQNTNKFKTEKLIKEVKILEFLSSIHDSNKFIVIFVASIIMKVKLLIMYLIYINN